MRDVDDVAVNYRRYVDAALAQVELPDLDPGARLERVDVSVGVAVDDQPLAVHHGHDRDRLRVHVGRLAARRRHPAYPAGPLVERHVTVPRGTAEAAPGRADDAQDHPVLVDDRRRRAPAVAGRAPEILGQAPAPDDVAVAVEAVQVAVDVQRVEMPGLGIPGHVAPAHPVERDRRIEDAEGMLPQLRAVLGVPAGDDLLLLDAVTRAAVGAHAPVEHGRRRTADILLEPDQVLAVDRPARHESGLIGYAGLRPSAPARPVLGRRGRGREHQACNEDGQGSRAQGDAVSSLGHPAVLHGNGLFNLRRTQILSRRLGCAGRSHLDRRFRSGVNCAVNVILRRILIL